MKPCILVVIFLFHDTITMQICWIRQTQSFSILFFFLDLGISLRAPSSFSEKYFSKPDPEEEKECWKKNFKEEGLQKLMFKNDGVHPNSMGLVKNFLAIRSTLISHRIWFKVFYLKIDKIVCIQNMIWYFPFFVNMTFRLQVFKFKHFKVLFVFRRGLNYVPYSECCILVDYTPFFSIGSVS